ncbi:toxin-antitoxin system YwqK family antitoxin [Leptotrichia sp. OH3620_COT-345]|uniref:toxin-antitoxin system YwqK family antitoxin n=1 Tax=Leptotrichia sp. OH3620_COT-345 TaxID=2491048 RepID=UPI000F655B88|nr:toxin-antitoxin system YwqK family antitoxin [Leptotrichia sp. OH3620_COT-345]RRD39465.1 toxin-antitoxin system YwqK family antitoxin [Leptotrichia sp. OH3620_COT-345]
MKRKNIFFIAVFFLFSVISYGQDIFADYRVHFNKIYITNYVQRENDNLKLKRTDNFSHEILGTGNFRIFDSGGRQLDIALKDGIIEGQYNEYYSNGNLFTTGKYSDGKREGSWKIYSEKGQLWKSYEYKNNELNGQYISYYTNTGMREIVGNYKNDKPDGIWNEYYANGSRKKSGTYKDGKKIGIFVEWFINGTKKSDVSYIDDEINGKMNVYYENGILFYEADIKGREGNVKGYHQNGKISFEGKVTESRRIGTWNYYDNTGNLFNKIEY